MSPNILDGAGVSLDRQLSMIRFIRRKAAKGVTFDDIDFYMTVNHGVTSAWCTRFLKKWVRWKVVDQRGTKFYVNEEKWAIVQKAREDEASVL